MPRFRAGFGPGGVPAPLAPRKRHRRRLPRPFNASESVKGALVEPLRCRHRQHPRLPTVTLRAIATYVAVTLRATRNARSTTVAPQKERGLLRKASPTQPLPGAECSFSSPSRALES